LIEDWLTTEPQLTALAIVRRLGEKHPVQFGTRQHSIVQRLLKFLRNKAAKKLIAQEPLDATAVAPAPGAVDGSRYGGPDGARPQVATVALILPIKPRPLSGLPGAATAQDVAFRVYPRTIGIDAIFRPCFGAVKSRAANRNPFPLLPFSVAQSTHQEGRMQCNNTLQNHRILRAILFITRTR
jgi:hypothetical protein